MKVIIRKGIKSDMPSALRLIHELAVFENEPDAVELRLEDLENDGFGASPLFECYVAELENTIVGLALFYPRYSTWKGPTIHLEDLIVQEDKRQFKIGGQLYRKVIEHAYKLGVKRIEWNVLDWNTPAIDFYKNSGANVMNEWCNVQMDQKAMKTFLDN
ncbi:MAG: GNAT family N-acetyltransferase [Flavobacteriaceae bacterium]|nr:MAG: GNAT family N-acetyltransferase [Flavobacteriaceae bacterium]